MSHSSLTNVVLRNYGIKSTGRPAYVGNLGPPFQTKGMFKTQLISRCSACDDTETSAMSRKAASSTGTEEWMEEEERKIIFPGLNADRQQGNEENQSSPERKRRHTTGDIFGSDEDGEEASAEVHYVPSQGKERVKHDSLPLAVEKLIADKYFRCLRGQESKKTEDIARRSFRQRRDKERPMSIPFQDVTGRDVPVRKTTEHRRSSPFSGYPYNPGTSNGPGGQGFIILNGARRKTRRTLAEMTGPDWERHNVVSFDITKFTGNVKSVLGDLQETGPGRRYTTQCFGMPASLFENEIAVLQGLYQACKESIKFSAETIASTSTRQVQDEFETLRRPGEQGNATKSAYLPRESTEHAKEMVTGSSSEAEEQKPVVTEPAEPDMSISEVIEESIKLALQALGVSEQNQDMKTVWRVVSDSFTRALRDYSIYPQNYEEVCLLEDEGSKDEFESRKSGGRSPTTDVKVAPGGKASASDDMDKICAVCMSEDIPYSLTEIPEEDSNRRKTTCACHAILHANHDTFPPDVVEVREFVDGVLSVYTEPMTSQFVYPSENGEPCFQSRWKFQVSDSPSAQLDFLQHGTDSTDASIRIIYAVDNQLPKEVRSRSKLKTPKATAIANTLPKGDDEKEYLCVPRQSWPGGFPVKAEEEEKKTQQEKFLPADSRLHVKMWNFFHDAHRAGYKQGPPLVLKLSPEFAVEEAMEALMCRSRIPLSHYKALVVHIKDRDRLSSNQDKSQQLFQQFAKIFFSPNYFQIFEYSAEGSSELYLNPTFSGDGRMIEFAGMVLALSLLFRKYLGVRLPVSFYKCLLDRPFTVKDLKEIDPRLYEKLEWIKRNSLKDTSLHITFRIKEKYGSVKYYRELVPGGTNVKVTDANKQEFIERAVIWKLAERCLEQLKDFRRGFTSVLEPFLLSVFTAEELQLIVADRSEDLNEAQMQADRRGTW